jgi:copper transport protein
MWRQRVRVPRGVGWAVRLACCVIVGGSLLLIPDPAQAHAVLVSSRPAAGATLGVTPEAVVLTFDEPLVSRLSHVTVVDPTGRRFSDAVSGKTMQVPMSTHAPGVYRVDWTTVSQLDGHTVTGTFRFGVGVSVAASAAGGSPGPTWGDALVAAARSIEYALLLLACGLAVLRGLGPDLTMRLPVVAVAAGLLIAGAAVVLGEATLATSGVSQAGLPDYLTLGFTGWARVARVVLEVGLLITTIMRGRLSPWLLAAVVGAIAVAGHAADVDPMWVGMAVNAGHLAAAAVWAGGIMALAFVRVTGGWPTVGRALLWRFSRLAPWAFLTSVGLGAVQAALLLGGPGELLGTAYGRTLVAKAVGIAAMVPLSLLAWRRLRPMVRSEAALVLLVVAAAAMLSAYPVVPREAREAARSREGAATAAVSPFPRPGDLTIAGSAGDTLVGLSLHPGRPGLNQVFAYLAPSPPEHAEVRLSVAGRWSAFTACGPSCWSATVDLQSAVRLDVAVAGSGGGTATFVLPALPAQDGTALADRSVRRMDRLRSYQVREVLSGVRSTYAYARPHAMWVRTWYGDIPHDTVWLGSKIYVRSSPDSSWRLRSTGLLAPVPYFAWNPFKPFVATTVVGRATVGDVPVTLVSFFGGHGNDPEPVWFTLWIDQVTGRLLRSQMWAPNHVMDDVYHAFDQPVDIPHPRVG